MLWCDFGMIFDFGLAKIFTAIIYLRYTVFIGINTPGRCIFQRGGGGGGLFR